MGKSTTSIDLVKLAFYILKRIWLVILCAALGCGAMYWYTVSRQVDTYTASGTMYVYNGNPNVVNYQYTNTADLSSAVQLIDTYQVVVKSNKVMDAVAERLSPTYPTISPSFIAGSISMASVSETGVVQVNCVTRDAQMSADICNAVLDVAPAEIIRVVSAGSIEIVDYATTPTAPDAKSPKRRAMMGALAGAVAAAALLTVLFLLNRKITDVKDLTDAYTPPILSSVRRSRKDSEDPGTFLLTDQSAMEVLESYGKLRMNLIYMLVGKDSHTVVVTSAIPGEGKSTIASNLAISCAMGGRKVLLIDGDLRRACQRDIFGYDKHQPGLSEILAGSVKWQDAILTYNKEPLDILPAGAIPPNPAELLGTEEMSNLLNELENEYDLVLLDMPPINVVTDPLVVSAHVAGFLSRGRTTPTTAISGGL